MLCLPVFVCRNIFYLETFCGKLYFVFGLDVWPIGRPQIQDDLVEGVAVVVEAHEGTFEEGVVVGFHSKFCVSNKQIVVLFEKIFVSQTSFEMALFWPRVAEVEKNRIDFFREIRSNIYRIDVQDFDVV